MRFTAHEELMLDGSGVATRHSELRYTVGVMELAHGPLRSHEKRCTHKHSKAADTTWSKRKTMCLEPTLHEGTQHT